LYYTSCINFIFILKSPFGTNKECVFVSMYTGNLPAGGKQEVDSSHSGRKLSLDFFLSQLTRHLFSILQHESEGYA